MVRILVVLKTTSYLTRILRQIYHINGAICSNYAIRQRLEEAVLDELSATLPEPGSVLVSMAEGKNIEACMTKNTQSIVSLDGERAILTRGGILACFSAHCLIFIS